MYARMDVVLGVYWEDDRMFVQPLINEMDWFNSAGVMMRYWPVCAGFDMTNYHCLVSCCVSRFADSTSATTIPMKLDSMGKCFGA